MVKNNEPEETPFNMAFMYYVSLNRLRDEKDIAKINNDIDKRLNCSFTLFHNIIFKLNNKEIKNFENILEGARNKLKMMVLSSDANERYLLGLKINQSLDKFDKDFMGALHRYKMIFPNIKVRGVEDLKKRYGLNG